MAEGSTDVANKAPQSWPWLYEPKQDALASIREAHDKLLANDEALTELDFSETWDGTAVGGVAFVFDSLETPVGAAIAGGGAIETNVTVDFAKKTLTIPQFIASLLPAVSQTVRAEDVRYASLAPEPFDGTPVVMLSLWEALKERRIVNVHLRMSDAQNALLLINAVMRLVYEASGNNVVRTHRFAPVLAGTVSVIRCTAEQRDAADAAKEAAEEGLDKPSEAGAEPAKPAVPAPDMPPPVQMYYILDEESLGLYDNAFSPSPTYDFRFYSEETARSIDTIYICNLTGQLEVQQEQSVCIVNPSADESKEACFAELVSSFKAKSIRPKSQDIFTSGEKFEAFFKTKPPSSTFESKFTDFPLQPPPPAASQVPAASRFPPPQGAGAASGEWETPGAEAKEAPWLKNLLTGRHIATSNDELQVMWCVAEADIQQDINDGKIPEGTIDSAGLDPQSVEHLGKMVDEIKDQLLNNNYPVAVSRLQASRRFFGSTLLKEVADLPDIELMKRIYLLSG